MQAHSAVAPAFTAATATNTPAETRADQVSLDARNLSLGDALELLGRQTGVRFEIAPSVASTRVTQKLVDVPLHTALTTLAAGLDWFEVYESSGGSSARLVMVSVYPRGATQEVLADLAGNAARRQSIENLWKAARTELRTQSVSIADMEFEANLEAPNLDPADRTAPVEGVW